MAQDEHTNETKGLVSSKMSGTDLAKPCAYHDDQHTAVTSENHNNHDDHDDQHTNDTSDNHNNHDTHHNFTPADDRDAAPKPHNTTYLGNDTVRETAT